MSFRNRVVKGVVIAAGVAACNMDFEHGSSEKEATSTSSVTPTYVAGNPTCASLGYAYEGKIDSPDFGETVTVALPGGQSVTFTSDDDGLTVLSWSSTIGLDAVIVKAGPGAYVYTYDPEATSDTGLVTPNNNGGQQAQISHLSFCFDFEVAVSKTAATSFTRDHDWSIQKTAADTSLTLALGQFYDLAYTVVVAATVADSDWAVSGQVTVHNPDPTYPAVLASVTDELSGVGALALDCGVSFPYSLASGATLTCTYSSALADGSDRVNTATAIVAPSSKVGGGSGTADVTFGNPTTVTDECIDVSDSLAGMLGTVCAPETSHTFDYTIPVSYAACGDHELVNTATFASCDGETGSSSVTTTIEVPCTSGCTLTQGYWKTHSSHGPAPTDSAWAGKEDTTFFLSGQTYYSVLWTEPEGNAYHILAHQYIATEMNILNGASVTAAVQSAFDTATTLFQAYTPAQVPADAALSAQMVSLAGTLDAYNNGLVGPGHCSENPVL